MVEKHTGEILHSLPLVILLAVPTEAIDLNNQQGGV
jgi:hypothetical protein